MESWPFRYWVIRFGFDLSVFEDEEEIIEDDFDEELPDNPNTKTGYIYKLGRHRLMCGDSTNVEDVKKLMNDNLADLYLTDPPYNVSYEGKTKDKLKIQNDKMENDDFREF